MAAISEIPGVSEAVTLLRAARRPLVAGLGGASTEAQRAAVAIADRLGGVADWTTRPADAAAMLAFQTVGAVGATYGEAAERAGLVVCWSCKRSDAPFNPGDAAVIEVGAAGHALRPGADYEAAATLRGLLANVELDPAAVEQRTGLPLEAWRGLVDRMVAANYVVIVRGPRVGECGRAAVAALTQFAQELHAESRVAIVTPAATGNRHGAENVLAWQTGYPMAVDFGHGYPRYLPGECSTPTLLERGEVDTVLLLDDPQLASLGERARGHLAKSPRIQLTSTPEPGRGDATVIAVAPLEESGGTHYRSDGLALPLPVNPSAGAPTSESVLNEILAGLGP